ncbi:MAG: undecaprenyl-phosphate glucose phosphotransferase, partial [Hyphomicrobiaceae bacterium]|nr:undecaprenyl-phosphate glucose phosphotransferase [Hyphomicrobiaceae bacterium]
MDRRRTLRERPLSDAARAVLKDKPAKPISPAIVATGVLMAEVTMLVIIGLATSLAYLGFYGVTDLSNLVIMAAAPIGFGLLSHILGLYTPHGLREVRFMGPRLMAAWTAAILISLAVLFFMKLGAEFSRAWIGIWFLAGLAGLIGSRSIAVSMVRHWTQTRRLERRAVIIGGGPNAEKLVAMMEASPETDVRLLGFFDDRKDDRSPESCAGLIKLGNVDDLVEFGRHTRIDLMLVTLPITAESRVLSLLKKLWVLPVDIRLAAHTNKLRFRPRSYSYIGNVPFLDVFDRPMA